MHRLVVAALLTTACGHSDAFLGDVPPVIDEPFQAGTPVRVTFDPGMDRFPSFSPDGRSIVYSYQPTERDDRDRCIGIVPTNGGTRRGVCYTHVDGDDRTDALEWPATNTDGALLFTHYVSQIGDRIPERGSLRLGTVAQPLPGRSLLSLPNSVDGIGFTRIGPTRWASSTRFYFVAQDYLMMGSHANGNKKDTMYVGVALVRGDVTPSSASFAIVAETDSLSGFALSTGGDSIYFTRQNQRSLYAMSTSGGAAIVVYSATGIGRPVVRDPVRIGARIAVVVDSIDQVTGLFGVPPRGLWGAARIELVRPGTPGSEVFTTAGGTHGFGSLAAPPGGCAFVVERRLPLGISWTTDLELQCVGTSAACVCS